MKAIDELPESVRPDLVEALRQIADGTAKLADFVELYGVPYSALKLWVRDAS